MRTRNLFAPVGMALALTLAALPVHGQSPAPQNQQTPPSPEQRQPGAAQYSTGELKSFAGAAVEVQKIAQEYTSRLKAAESPAEQQSVREEAANKMMKAIKDEGLSIEKFDEIGNAAQADPQLAQQLGQFMQEAR